MSEAEYNPKEATDPDSDPDADVRTESMFDFLAEDGKRPTIRRPERSRVGERVMPIIRKPVPVSESGPLLPPKPGDPVEPPPQLTISKGDNSDFLDDVPPAQPSTARFSRQAVQHNVTQLKPGRSQPVQPELSDGVDKSQGDQLLSEDERTILLPTAQEAAAREPSPGNDSRVKENAKTPSTKLGMDSLDLNDEFDFDSDWRHGVHTQIDHVDEPKFLVKKRLIAAAVILIALGVGSFAFTQRAQLSQLLDSVGLELETVIDLAGSTIGGDSESVPVQGDSVVAGSSLDTELSEELPVAGFDITPSPLMQLFRDQLAALERLISEGSLDQAEQVLVTMDRTVYGYGAFEFAEIEARIALIRSGATVPSQSNDSAVAEDLLVQEQLAQQAAEAEVQRLERDRQALSIAKAEAQRLELERQAQLAAEAEAQRLEQVRQAQLAAEVEAQRLEQVRQAQLAAEAQRLEQQRQVQLAAQAEAQRLEQQRQAQLASAAEAQRLKQESQAQAAIERDNANWQVVDADRQATDRRIAEQRAAAQRQQARDQRLAQARERADAQARERQRQQAAVEAAQVARAAASSASASTSEATTSSNLLASSNQTITDADIQVVYQRFAQLQQAVNARDINAVIALTQRSGTRVQQFLQMFENSVSIDSRIRNVSTRSAAGEIHGTLQITGVTRANGNVIKPSASVASVSLTSRRDGQDWSAISW